MSTIASARGSSASGLYGSSVGARPVRAAVTEFTGTAINPARAFGPNLLAGDLAPLWIYLVAPVVGGVLAALLYDRVLSSAEPPEAS